MNDEFQCLLLVNVGEADFSLSAEVNFKNEVYSERSFSLPISNKLTPATVVSPFL